MKARTCPRCNVTMGAAGTAGKNCGDIVQCQRCGRREYAEPERAAAETERIWAETERMALQENE